MECKRKNLTEASEELDDFLKNIPMISIGRRNGKTYMTNVIYDIAMANQALKVCKELKDYAYSIDCDEYIRGDKVVSKIYATLEKYELDT